MNSCDIYRAETDRSITNFIVELEAAWYVKFTDRIFGAAPGVAPVSKAA